MVWHGSPWVILGGRLWVPHITGVTSELTRLQCLSDSVCVDDLATGGVDQVAALLEVLEHLGVEQVVGTRVKGAVDGDDVTLLHQVGRVLDVAAIELLFETGWELLVVRVQELSTVKVLHTTQPFEYLAGQAIQHRSCS